MTNLTNLISPAEKMLKKALKKGEMEVMDNEEYMKIWDEIDEIMEDVHRDYIIKSHQSWIDAEKVIISQNYN